MQHQIRQVKSEGIHSPQKMVDLIADHRQWHIEFRVVGREGLLEGPHRYFLNDGVFKNQQSVIEINKVVAERLSEDGECQKEETEKNDEPFHSLHFTPYLPFFHTVPHRAPLPPLITVPHRAPLPFLPAILSLVALAKWEALATAGGGGGGGGWGGGVFFFMKGGGPPGGGGGGGGGGGSLCIVRSNAFYSFL